MKVHDLTYILKWSLCYIYSWCKQKWGDELGDHNSNPGEKKGQQRLGQQILSDQIKLYFRSKSYSIS